MFRLPHLLFLLPLFPFLFTACTVPAPTCQQDTIRYPQGQTLHGAPIRLGIIDASPLFLDDLPQALSASQAQLAVIDDVRWGYIEPNAPQGDAHAYHWNDPPSFLDDRVLAYQEAGFEVILVLRAWNPWARAIGPQGGLPGASASTPPKDIYLDDYAAWVQAVVERYDHDGFQDFPGLKAPIRYVQIETEATTGVWWQGTSPDQAAAQYVTLLRTAANAARDAAPQTQILLGGIAATDMLDHDPTPAELEDIVRNISPDVCGALTAFQTILAAQDAYDIIAVHSMADASGLATLADWIATLTGDSKPVWIMGATSAPALTGDPTLISVNPLFPIQGETLWRSLQDPTASDHPRVVQWYRAEQARLSFRKWVMAAAYGFDVLVLGYEQDRPTYEHSEYGLRDLAFQGLTDTSQGIPQPRPALYALATAQTQLGDYTQVRILKDYPPPIHAFAFMVEGQPVYVLWYDDGIAQTPDHPPATYTLQLQTSDPSILRFTIPTQPGQTSPIVDVVPAQQGKITLTLDETPIILRGHIAPIPSSTTFIPFILH